MMVSADRDQPRYRRRRNGEWESEQAAIDRRRFEHDLKRAVEQETLALQFQPRVNLVSGQPSGAEPSVRWSRRRHGLVPAAALAPLAEECGLTSQIGGFMLTHACLEAATWPDPLLTLSVDVTIQQVREGVLLGQVGTALKASRLAAERLELELAEASLAEIDEEAWLGFAALRDLGVGLALDHMGAGFSGFAALRRLPFTTLKLDRSLVRDVERDPDAAAIAQALIGAGCALGLGVVADGVETEPQRHLLAGFGCSEGQGNLFGRPRPPAALRAGVAQR